MTFNLIVMTFVFRNFDFHLIIVTFYLIIFHFHIIMWSSVVTISTI